MVKPHKMPTSLARETTISAADDIGHNHIGHTKHHIGHKACHVFVRLSHVHAIAEKCDYRRKWRDNGDNRRIRRQSHFSATVWTGL